MIEDLCDNGREKGERQLDSHTHSVHKVPGKCLGIAVYFGGKCEEGIVSKEKGEIRGDMAWG